MGKSLLFGYAKTLHSAPRLLIHNMAARIGPSNNLTEGSDDFIPLTTFYHVYDAPYRNTGALYAVEMAQANYTGQRILRSLDGGITWTKLGKISLDMAGGARIRRIYVDPNQETIYIQRTANINASPVQWVIESYDNTLNKLGELDIGSHYMHAASHSMDSYAGTMLAEYGSDNESVFRVWKTTNRGVTWTEVFSQTGNNNVPGSGEVRHFHCIQVDPFTGYWWLASGDLDAQCKIWRSTNAGSSWQLMASGSQEVRTLGFIFENDRMYYAMDASVSIPTQIFQCDKTTFARTPVGSQLDRHPIYALTRTYWPEGFLVWPNYEAVYSPYSGRLALQFFDYATNTLKTVAEIPLSGISQNENIGFAEASRFQDKFNGAIMAEGSWNLIVAKYGQAGNSVTTSQVISGRLIV